MLKRRIIPKLLLKESRFAKSKMVLVTSVNFSNHIEIGDPISQAKIYQAQMADELLFIDIDASRLKRKTLLIDIIKSAASELFMPLTVGGGIDDIDDFRSLLLNGADKVCINTAAIDNPDLITKAARTFGSQCVVVAIDFKKTSDGKYHVFKRCGSEETSLDPLLWAKESERRGAGEILLTSIDNDGKRNGLDIPITKQIAESINIPVIASGGCGLAKHFIDGFQYAKVDAIAAGTYFCFKDENPMQVRSQIKNAGIPIRIAL